MVIGTGPCLSLWCAPLLFRVEGYGSGSGGAESSLSLEMSEADM